MKESHHSSSRPLVHKVQSSCSPVNSLCSLLASHRTLSDFQQNHALQRTTKSSKYNNAIYEFTFQGSFKSCFTTRSAKESTISRKPFTWMLNKCCPLLAMQDQVHQWLCGRVPDSQSGSCRFESRPGLLHTKVYSAFHPSRVSKWVPAAAGKAKAASIARSARGWNAGCAGKTVLSPDIACYTWWYTRV